MTIIPLKKITLFLHHSVGSDSHNNMPSPAADEAETEAVHRISGHCREPEWGKGDHYRRPPGELIISQHIVHHIKVKPVQYTELETVL